MTIAGGRVGVPAAREVRRRRRRDRLNRADRSSTARRRVVGRAAMGTRAIDLREGMRGMGLGVRRGGDRQVRGLSAREQWRGGGSGAGRNVVARSVAASVEMRVAWMQARED